LRLSVYETRTGGGGNFKIKERWGKTFQQIPAGTDVEITTGHFSGLPIASIYSSLQPATRSFVLSGEDGEIIWSRQTMSTYSAIMLSVRDFNPRRQG
jgi:hypothetical protein